MFGGTLGDIGLFRFVPYWTLLELYKKRHCSERSQHHFLSIPYILCLISCPSNSNSRRAQGQRHRGGTNCHRVPASLVLPLPDTGGTKKGSFNWITCIASVKAHQRRADNAPRRIFGDNGARNKKKTTQISQRLGKGTEQRITALQKCA